MVQKHVLIDGNILREKAKSLYEHYVRDVPQEQRKKFKGKYYSFVQRFDLKNLKVTGESASADTEAASAFLSVSRSSMKMNIFLNKCSTAMKLDCSERKCQNTHTFINQQSKQQDSRHGKIV